MKAFGSPSELVHVMAAGSNAELGCTLPDSLKPLSVGAKRNPETVTALKVYVLNAPLTCELAIVVQNGHGARIGSQ